MIGVSLLIGLVAAVLLLQTVADLWSVARIALGPGCPDEPPVRDLPRLLFLIPAHDEELLIESCVRSLLALAYPPTRFRVVVVADNCSDRTAQCALAAGAQCLERDDPHRCGKPHAIAWALERLPLREYDAVAIVDADTVVDPGFAAGLAAAAPLNDRAAQGYNGVLNPDDSAITRMAAVFADAKCRFAYGLKQRAGLNIPLRLGGCIGTSVLMKHGWNAFTIGEDWELYAFLTAQGVRMVGADGARVYAQEARSLRQSSSQRQRWTAGKLTVLGRLAPTLMRSRNIDPLQKLDVIAELSAPGPAAHVGGAAALGVVTAVLHLPGGPLLLVALAAGVLRQVAYTLAALCVQPRPVQAALAFAFLPIYALWRVTIEIAALGMIGDKPWVRTERHRPASGD
jgi:cellulose synthase/poly-beta-1,6-N-acetylglucosamine synthase-like glycosyltransferase